MVFLLLRSTGILALKDTMKSYKNIIIGFASIFVIFNNSCKHNASVESKNQAFPKDSIVDAHDSVTPIVILASGDDPKSLENISLLHHSVFMNSQQEYPDRDALNQSVQFTMDYIPRPRIIRLSSFGDSVSYQATRLLVTPGDSVVLSMENKKIVFTGKNAAHYNFYYQLDSSAVSEWSYNKYEGDLWKYKKGAEDIHRRNMEFFNEYITEHKVSEDFINTVGAELKFEYLYNLIAPRARETGFDFKANNPEFLRTVSKDYDVEQHGFIDMQAYLDHVTIDDFQRPDLLGNYFFQRSLISFIRNYFVSTDHLTYNLKNFQAEEAYIQEHLDGKLEEYALTRLLQDYFEKGLGQGKEDNEYIKLYIAKHKNNIQNPKGREAFELIEEELAFKGFRFAEGAWDEEILTISGDTLTMGQVLKKTENKIKVFDFWASWCAPCISEILNTPEFRAALNAEYDLEWILVSIDSDHTKWLETSQRLETEMNSPFQYRILDIKTSRVVNSLVEGTVDRFFIPRYVVVGPDGQTEVYAAPKPSDTLLFKRVIDKVYLR